MQAECARYGQSGVAVHGHIDYNFHLRGWEGADAGSIDVRPDSWFCLNRMAAA